jgi:hypothetical protein
MTRTKTITLAVLAVAFVVLVVRFIRSGSQEEIRTAAGASATPSSVAGPEAKEADRLKVTVFFGREEDDLLVGETREIPAGTSAVQEARDIVTELIKGPAEGSVPTLSSETKIEQIFITKDGTAYVDLSRDVVAHHPSGSSAEIATVFAIVNSLAYNIKAVKRVFILVDGEERETLNGHLSLSRSLRPNYSLIAK